MKYLILACAALLSACTDMTMERFALRTTDGKEFTLICPVHWLGAGKQLPPDRCYVEMSKEQR